MLNRFYLGFFNRAPDPGGLAGWTSSLDSGTPPAQVANNFFYSPEFYSSGILIGAAYLAVQGRDPDYAGFESYLPQLQRELLEVIAKYEKLDLDLVSVALDKKGGAEVLEINIVLPEEKRAKSVRTRQQPAFALR